MASVSRITTFDELIEFLQRFHYLFSEAPHIDDGIIPAELPQPLKDLYRELGVIVAIEKSRSNDYRAPFAAQDTILPLSRLKRIDGMVEFAWENQGNWSCRCSLGESDPPVYSDAAESWGEGHGFEEVCEHLSHFLTTLALQEAVMSCPVLLSAEEETVIEVLDRQPPALWLNGISVFKEEPSHNFYFEPDCDLLVMEYGGVWLGSHADEFRQLIRKGIQLTTIQ